MAGDPTRQLPQHLLTLAHGMQRALGVGEEGLPRLRQPRPTAAPDQQLRPERRLQRAEARAQRGLRDEERPGRPRDGAALSDLDERLQLRMHKPSLCK